MQTDPNTTNFYRELTARPRAETLAATVDNVRRTCVALAGRPECLVRIDEERAISFVEELDMEAVKRSSHYMETPVEFRDMQSEVCFHVALHFLLIVPALSIAGCSRPPEEPLLGTAYVRPTDEMVMIHVPSGEFQMGSSEDDIESAFELCTHYWGNCDRERFYDELPPHAVALDDYWIDRTEVKNEQYSRCVEAEVCEEPACWAGLQFDDPDHPVVCVTWDQAQAYCEWVGGRLPTEAEWEYAARGPDGLRYPWGDSFVGAWLNYCDETCARPRSDPAWNDGQLYTAQVGHYPDGASWCGALDMAGNVSEWAGDWYGGYDSKWSVNPLGPANGHLRVIRGGSWFLTRAETRATWRGELGPGIWFDDLGFRCVISVLQEEH